MIKKLSVISSYACYLKNKFIKFSSYKINLGIHLIFKYSVAIERDKNVIYLNWLVRLRVCE